jgi:hypothetical protein
MTTRHEEKNQVGPERGVYTQRKPGVSDPYWYCRYRYVLQVRVLSREYRKFPRENHAYHLDQYYCKRLCFVP